MVSSSKNILLLLQKLRSIRHPHTKKRKRSSPSTSSAAKKEKYKKKIQCVSSMEVKMQHELTQVEAQIYDLETAFLTLNRYGGGGGIPSSSNVLDPSSALEVSNEPETTPPSESQPSSSDKRRIFSQTSMTSPIEPDSSL